MQTRARTVLVVDDEDIIRDIIRRKIMASTDFGVVEAQNGFEGGSKI